MICKYGIHPDVCDAMRAMGVNILEKVGFTKPRILDNSKIIPSAIPEVFSRKRECQSNNIDMAKVNIEISTPNRNPPEKNMINRCKTLSVYNGNEPTSDLSMPIKLYAFVLIVLTWYPWHQHQAAFWVWYPRTRQMISWSEVCRRCKNTFSRQQATENCKTLFG